MLGEDVRIEVIEEMLCISLQNNPSRCNYLLCLLLRISSALLMILDEAMAAGDFSLVT